LILCDKGRVRGDARIDTLLDEPANGGEVTADDGVEGRSRRIGGDQHGLGRRGNADDHQEDPEDNQQKYRPRRPRPRAKGIRTRLHMTRNLPT